MRPTLALLTALLLGPLAAMHGADSFLVEDGQPRAEIVIAENPQRTVRVAARDLQRYVQKMSGAPLPIVTTPTGTVAKLFVGRSPHTDRLGVTAQGLKDGAYRIASGGDWMAFIGDDTDFTPIEPWARNNGDIKSGKLQREWEKITGALWGVPHTGMYKNRIRFPGDIGLPDRPQPGGKIAPLELWGFDERGSFNAVSGWLQELGVRWYLPGELGEVVPVLKSIPLPKVNQIVRPDFAMRRFNFRFSTGTEDTALWAMHLGVRDPFGVQVAHGMATMTGRDEIFAAHPDWFALYGGKRHYQPGYSKNQLCYSNEDLFRETVRNVRAQFDHYHYDAVSVMPPDGYTAICQCPLCKGKDTPERNERGLLSDYVWDFVNRVAREVRKTHPDGKIINCAYGVYTLPPLKIDRLEPNVQVCIVGGRRPINKGGPKGEGEAAPEALRAAWVKKTDNPILIFENYPFTDRGWYLPSFAPHALGDTVNATKGVSSGEDIWLSMGKDFDTAGIGFNHFMVYFTARMYWGGKQADVDAMFREYCRLFYGPAEAEMRAFFEYCEANWQDMEKDKPKADAALALFSRAQSKAGATTVHGRRIALINDFLKGLRNKSAQLAQKRGVVPKLRLVGEPRTPIVIDGRLDDEAWMHCPTASTGRFRELQTGRAPAFGTTVKSAWIGHDLYFAIRCDEHPGEKLNIATTKNEDAALWYGDAVEILIETDSHSYYQIAVNPAGAIIDLDRGADKSSRLAWSSQAQVAAQIADDHWTVEIRIPATQDENDPLHQVIGRKPTQSLPWHINVCRQRIRENGSEYSAFSPTGTAGFHVPMRFAHFYDGRSHEFEADPTVSDYLTASRAAGDLMAQRKYDEALAAFTGLAARDGLTDFQRCDALSRAANCARTLKDYDRAGQLAGQAKIEGVASTIRMQNLVAQRAFAEVIEKFGNEDIRKWPFWIAADAYLARGRALAATGATDRAKADFRTALEFASDKRMRQEILRSLGEDSGK
jgi:tetratricopeptide (TPR) repeat protein